MYNKSKIFKRAWEIVKNVGATMGEALKRAWDEAKHPRKERLFFQPYVVGELIDNQMYAGIFFYEKTYENKELIKSLGYHWTKLKDTLCDYVDEYVESSHAWVKLFPYEEAREEIAKAKVIAKYERPFPSIAKKENANFIAAKKALANQTNQQ